MWQTEIAAPTPQNIQRAADLLRQGEVVGIPTETVYGLAGSSFNAAAVHKIFAAKGRPQDNPLISHIADLDMLPLVNTDIPDSCYALAQAFWPGPLTLIMRKAPRVCSEVCAGLQTASVRMPSHPVARSIIAAAGVPLAAPSANVSGRPSPTDAETVCSDLQGKIPLIIDGGACSVGVESTVVSLVDDEPVLLRPGYITAEDIARVLGRPVKVADAVLHALRQGEAVLSPGMKYKHYAPRAEVTLVRGSLENYIAFVRQHAGQGVYGLCFDGEQRQIPLPCITYGAADDPAQQAQRLFAALRELDNCGAQTVYARCPLHTGIAMAVYNRLLRAAAFRVVEV